MLFQWLKSVWPYLLGLVEAVDFIDEQDGFPLAQPQLILRLFNHLSHIIGGGTCGGHGDKTSRALLFTFAGNYVSQCGLKRNTCRFFNKINILLEIISTFFLNYVNDLHVTPGTKTADE